MRETSEIRVSGQTSVLYLDGQPDIIEIVSENGGVVLAAARPHEEHPYFADVRVDPLWWPDRYRIIRADEVPHFASNLQAAVDTLVGDGLISIGTAHILSEREHEIPRFYVPGTRGRAVLLDHVLAAARHIARAAEG